MTRTGSRPVAFLHGDSRKPSDVSELDWLTWLTQTHRSGVGKKSNNWDEVIEEGRDLFDNIPILIRTGSGIPSCLPFNQREVTGHRGLRELSSTRYCEAEVLQALLGWCHRHIDEPLQQIGTGKDLAVIAWYDGIYGWFWSGSLPRFHRIWVVKSPQIHDILLPKILSISTRNPLEFPLVAGLLRYGISSRMEATAIAAIARASDYLAENSYRGFDLITLAGLIVLSQTVAHQVQAAGRARDRTRGETRP